MSFRLSCPVVLSFGEESFFLDRDIDFLKRYPGRDVILLDGADVTDDQVVSACETISVDFENPGKITPKIVIVDNVTKVKGDKKLKEFLASRRKGDTHCVLAVVARTDKAPALWAKLDKGIVLMREHKKLKTWDNNNEVVKWTVEEAKRMGFNLDLRSAMALFQLTGGDLHRISNELGKLLLLVGRGGSADLERMKMVASRSSGAEPWNVVEAALLKDRVGALNALNLLYRFSSDDPSIALLGAMAKGVERVFIAVSMLRRGRSAEEVASRLSMHPFRFQKTVQVQAARHSEASLVGVMEKLSKLDVELKRTSHRRTLMELVILDIAT